MNKNTNEEIKNMWNERSDEYYKGIYKETEKLITDPTIAFLHKVWENISTYYAV